MTTMKITHNQLICNNEVGRLGEACWQGGGSRLTPVAIVIIITVKIFMTIVVTVKEDMEDGADCLNKSYKFCSAHLDIYICAWHIPTEFVLVFAFVFVFQLYLYLYLRFQCIIITS